MLNVPCDSFAFILAFLHCLFMSVNYYISEKPYHYWFLMTEPLYLNISPIHPLYSQGYVYRSTIYTSLLVFKPPKHWII